MAHSKLCDKVYNVDGRDYGTSGRKISKITVHHAAGSSSLDGFMSTLQSNPAASWNYAITSDGQIGCYVPEERGAWTSSSKENDIIAVTIEVADHQVGNSWKCTTEAWNALIALCVDICQRNNIKELKYTGPDVAQLPSTKIPHPAHKTSNLTRHDMFKNKLCPGPWLGTRFSTLCTLVNKELKSGWDPVADKKKKNKNFKTTIVNKNSGSTTTASTSVSGDNNDVTYLDPKDYIDDSKIDPYIAIFTRNTNDVNISKLKKMGTFGGLVYGGSYFTSEHNVRSSYKPANIDRMTNKLVKAKMYYGIWVDVYATSIEEVRLECTELYRVISPYSTQLGVWLKLHLTKPKSINNKILDEYYRYMKLWGLEEKCGLYATEAQLAKIDWSDKFANKYHLLLDKPLKKLNPLDELLTPELFQVN